MKLLDLATDQQASADACAALLVETIPTVMRAIRAEMRKHTRDLSVPQFRTLTFLGRNPGASLSQVATHLGLALPTMSKLIDALVDRHLVSRQASATDRRRVTLALTDRGAASVEAAREATQTRLADRLSVLTSEQRGTLAHALDLLHPVFAAARLAPPVGSFCEPGRGD